MITRPEGVLLTDGREVQADIVVLAMGNLAPRPPGGPDAWLDDIGYFVPNPDICPAGLTRGASIVVHSRRSSPWNFTILV